MQLRIDPDLHRPATTARPRLAFVGLGWIGRNRMQAIADQGGIDIVALADPSEDCVAEAAALIPGVLVGRTLADALAAKPDGVVIASPSALHAAQAIEALEAGCAVFCQKPLGRNAHEARAVVAAARKVDRLLAVDLSYRGTRALQMMHEGIRAGDIGQVFALDLVFHNAYGPEKPWFYDKALSGGGPLIDLGVHLVDAALWLLDFPRINKATGQIFRQGSNVVADDKVEDYATASLTTGAGAAVNLACSWRLHAGVEARIEIHAHGTEGGLSLTNPGGGFYDFALHRHNETTTEPLLLPPDDWGGRMAQAWVRQLSVDAAFDPAAEQLISLSEIIDRIYASSRSGG